MSEQSKSVTHNCLYLKGAAQKHWQAANQSGSMKQQAVQLATSASIAGQSYTFWAKVYSAGEERNICDVGLNIRVVKDVAVTIQASQA